MTRTGDLDHLAWGVSRLSTKTNGDHSEYNRWFDSTLRGQTVNAPNDVRIIDGQLVESLNDRGPNDDGGQDILAMYPKQPFDFAGRTGTVKFDVSNDTQGAHAAWPEFWITNRPVPAPGGPQPTMTPRAEYSVGISFARLCDGYAEVGVDRIVTTKNYVETVYGAGGPCVPVGSPTSMNHVEIQVSASSVQVWMSTDAGPRTLVADEQLEVPLTRGVIWIEHATYNADKFEHQADHSFTWDNVGFDGPKTYRDRTFDVLDGTERPSDGANGGVNLGYRLAPNNEVLTLRTGTPVTWDKQPTLAFATFNWVPTATATVPQVRVNGGAWQTLAWPFGEQRYAWFTVAIPIPLADALKPGPATIEFRDVTSTVIANVNLALIDAAPVP